jgi:hypothetical protein
MGAAVSSAAIQNARILTMNLVDESRDGTRVQPRFE